MDKIEYDFLVWTSFPSSIKGVNDQGGGHVFFPMVEKRIPVRPGSTVRIEVNAKQVNVRYSDGDVVASHAYLGETFKGVVSSKPLTRTDFDWTAFKAEFIIPSDVDTIIPVPRGGAGSKEAPGTTWLDDLRIYQDDVLIYDNYFTALRPGKVVPNMITPPEIIIGAVQRWKAGRAGEEILRRPLAIASI